MILIAHRVEGERPDAVEREHRFDDHRPADQTRQQAAGEGGERNQRMPAQARAHFCRFEAERDEMVCKRLPRRRGGGRPA